jgi:hypothetical protein
MLGIGRPDRHALPRFILSKTNSDRDVRSPPARAGSFFGSERSSDGFGQLMGPDPSYAGGYDEGVCNSHIGR